MAKTFEKTAKSKDSVKAPALSREAREKQLINLAYNEAERRILDGTATSQLLCEFLKRDTATSDVERRLLEKELELKNAKIEALETAKRTEELYSEAMKAMKRYSGNDDNYNGDDYYDQ